MRRTRATSGTTGRTPIGDVSDTAFWIAQQRAIESARPDALFSDPLAAHLAGTRGREIAAEMPAAKIVAWQVAIRTVVIDQFIRTAIAEGADTIVNLGAGLDARPYRMDLPPSLHWIEADYHRLIEHKENLLAADIPRCWLERVKIDLADTAQRRRLLASINARSGKLLVLTEGVLPYLDNPEVAALADDLRALDRARYWIVDYVSADALRFKRPGMGRRMRHAPFKFAPPDWSRFFGERGWRCRDLRYLPEESARLGRRVPLPVFLRALIGLSGPFVSKERREALRKFTGYALLEPAEPSPL